MDNILQAITIFSWIMLAFLIIKVIIFSFFSNRHYRQQTNGSRKNLGKYKPLVSIIIPCYNEESTLANCVKSLLKQTYKFYEIVIVDDGSNDQTRAVAESLVIKYPDRVRYHFKENGGKASALNYGLYRAHGEIIVVIDADSIFLKDTLRQLVISFNNPEVAAVGGNVKVANRGRFLNKHQAMEYIMGLNLHRRTFAHLNCMQVISGAIGAFRKEVLQEVGGYSSQTIVEDMDITIAIAKAGYKIIYNAKAIAYTEVPEKINDLLVQRYRWTYGGFQVLKKYKDLLFNPEYKELGLIGIPYFLIFPWVDVIISLLFFIALFRVFMAGSFISLIIFYFCMSLIQVYLTLVSLIMDKEDKKLIFMAGIDSLWYNHLISFVTLSAGINFIRGAQVSWNKMVRLGKNYITVTAE